MFDLRAKQQLNRGYSDGMARGIEIVVTPLIFGGIGWLLDGWLGTGPVLAIVFGIFGVAGHLRQAEARLRPRHDRRRGRQALGPRHTTGRSAPRRRSE